MVKVYKYGSSRYINAILTIGILIGIFYFIHRNELFNYEAIMLFVLMTIFCLLLISWQFSSKIILKEGNLVCKCFGMVIKEIKIKDTLFEFTGYEDPNSYSSLTSDSEPYYKISTKNKLSQEYYGIKIYNEKDYHYFVEILQKVIELT